MIIERAQRISGGDLSEYAWAGLRRFQNISYVEDRIFGIHKLPKKHAANVRKQASQIRYCLIQAKEYFDAAQQVSLATKPNLLYYSLMSLALAEILYKQSGDSSLDRARKQHRHHGLELRANSGPHLDVPLEHAASLLKAVPLEHPNGDRFGTFELWHRSCREMPLAGSVTTTAAGSSMTTFSLILGASDERLMKVPPSGLSLLDCFLALPGMVDFLNAHSLASKIVRGTLSSTWHGVARKHATVNLILHPGPDHLIASFLENFSVHPGDWDKIDYQEFASGGAIHWSNDYLKDEHPRLILPPGSMLSAREVRFWPSQQPLNEFGYMYVALFICGNYARYYPDQWLGDVERSTALALAIEELVRLIEGRMALLVLSELSGTYIVPE